MFSPFKRYDPSSNMSITFQLHHTFKKRLRIASMHTCKQRKKVSASTSLLALNSPLLILETVMMQNNKKSYYNIARTKKGHQFAQAYIFAPVHPLLIMMLSQHAT